MPDLTMQDIISKLRDILTPDKLLAVYHHKFGGELGANGRSQFLPQDGYLQAFYDLVYHDMLMPMSEIPLEDLLAIDLTQVLPDPHAIDFPEQCAGLITALDQGRVLTADTYNHRYTRCFFNSLAEKLARSLTALPEDVRPDGKQAWLSRGYTHEEWLNRVLWLWAPLVHSDNFMVNDWQRLKDFCHSRRANVESYYQVKDPYAHLEAADDVDIHLFPRMAMEGPPKKSPSDPGADLTVADYAFW